MKGRPVSKSQLDATATGDDVGSKPASESLLALANRITAGAIMTPRERLVVTQWHATVGQALDQMGTSFDQLPVFEETRFVGLVCRSELAGKPRTTSLADAVIPIERLPHIRPDTPIREVAGVLVYEPCVIVAEGDPIELRGLIHFCDLNRHAVRSNAYLWLSAFEMSLAEWLRHEAPDPMQWLKVLDEHRQVMILGRWAYDQQQGIQLDGVEAAELADLIRAVRNLPNMLEKLGYSRSQFDKKTGHLVKLRNGVMHPVRSIIRQHEDVQQLVAVYVDLVELLDGIRRVVVQSCSACTES